MPKIVARQEETDLAREKWEIYSQIKQRSQRVEFSTVVGEVEVALCRILNKYPGESSRNKRVAVISVVERPASARTLVIIFGNAAYPNDIIGARLTEQRPNLEDWPQALVVRLKTSASNHK